MDNFTASEITRLGVGVFLLCATVAAPKVDAFISASLPAPPTLRSRPPAMAIFTVTCKQSSPIDGQKPGTSGLRKFPHFLLTLSLLAAFVSAVEDAIAGATPLANDLGEILSDEFHLIMDPNQANSRKAIGIPL